MTSTFTVDGRTLRLPVAVDWAADVADGRLRLTRFAADALPPPVIEVGFRPAPDLKGALDDEIGDLVMRLTDFTILHVEARRLRPANWTAEPPPMPFVFAGYRQGVFSMVIELGIAGSDGTDAAVAFSACLLEDAAAMQPDVDAMLDGLEVDWS